MKGLEGRLERLERRGQAQKEHWGIFRFAYRYTTGDKMWPVLWRPWEPADDEVKVLLPEAWTGEDDELMLELLREGDRARLDLSDAELRRLAYDIAPSEARRLLEGLGVEPDGEVAEGECEA